MSSLVYFKFKANVKTDSIPFDGSVISVKELKSAIRTKSCLYSQDFDLKLEDVNGKNEELIPKYASIVVRRVPKLNNDTGRKKSKSTLKLKDKVWPSYSVKARPYVNPPSTYICHKCGKSGHWISNCPGILDNTGKMVDIKSVKRPTGIPQDFLLQVDAGTPGAYLSRNGVYTVPIKDAEAYAQGKKDKRPFSAEENPPYIPPEEKKPPSCLICPLCSNIFKDAVVVSCCGTTFCNDCIVGHAFDAQVLGSGKCPKCQSTLESQESSIFENSTVRSIIAEWKTNQNSPVTNDVESEKPFVNNRRVLKPKQAMVPSSNASGIDVQINENSEKDLKNFPKEQCVENNVTLSSTCNLLNVTSKNTCSSHSVISNSMSLGSNLSSSNFSNLSCNVSGKNLEAPSSIISASSAIPGTVGLYANSMANALPSVNTASSLMMNSDAPVVLGGASSLNNTLARTAVGHNPQTELSNPMMLTVNQAGLSWNMATSAFLSCQSNGATHFPQFMVPSGDKILSKEEFERVKKQMIERSRNKYRGRSRSPHDGYRSRNYRSPYSSRYSRSRREHRRSPSPAEVDVLEKIEKRRIDRLSRLGSRTRSPRDSRRRVRSKERKSYENSKTKRSRRSSSNRTDSPKDQRRVVLKGRSPLDIDKPLDEIKIADIKSKPKVNHIRPKKSDKDKASTILEDCDSLSDREPLMNQERPIPVSPSRKRKYDRPKVSPADKPRRNSSPFLGDVTPKPIEVPMKDIGSPISSTAPASVEPGEYLEPESPFDPIKQSKSKKIKKVKKQKKHRTEAEKAERKLKKRMKKERKLAKAEKKMKKYERKSRDNRPV